MKTSPGRFDLFRVKSLGITILLLFSPMVALSIEETKLIERRPATIQRTNDDQVRALIEADITIDPLRAKTIEVFVNDQEFDWVRSQGWEIEWVPDADLPYWTERKVEPGPLQTPLDFYPTYEQLTNDLEILSASYPNLCRLESIGKSVLGRDLWFLKITDNPGIEENEPEVKFISTMHGDETLGTVLMLNLIHLLLEDYTKSDGIRELVDETEIWIMPLMNPDGYSKNPRSRYNDLWVDLNRSFPDPIYDPINTPDGRPAETQAVMEFGFAHSSVLSANFHGGEIVVNYPFDHQLPACPDDDVFINVSRAYADLNPPMFANNSPTYGGGTFDHGIVRGALWYVVNGGMQDWNYLWLGCKEVTIELQPDKSPGESLLGSLWDDNRESLLAYMEKVCIGVRGLVTASNTGQPLAATIHVTGRDHDVYTDPDVGDYHRMLLPGTYDLTFSAEGYEPRTIEDVTVEEGPATVLDVTLESESQPSSMWQVR